jgi:hypothetical protein
LTLRPAIRRFAVSGSLEEWRPHRATWLVTKLLEDDRTPAAWDYATYRWSAIQNGNDAGDPIALELRLVPRARAREILGMDGETARR